MKSILTIIILISLNCVMAEEVLFISPNLNIDNITIQYGPTPYLQMEGVQEKGVPEINIIEELEMQVIETDVVQRCV